ncbi:hypothetical protein TRFO_31615 [Tritrichomonas foetus]|uniref:Uncharacterized protein n=1 Tax=Tritrichomonas foetus TaxID=1144522 RepID=A0A1J4JRZ2_9EUKA|nr:hypothetical protein TRFO_31615 [Tritrichomonas foetus]|eukprot:OHT01522.1 hypothetical protein TRFO_31615 [Tritrichomonas foetus]
MSSVYLPYQGIISQSPVPPQPPQAGQIPHVVSSTAINSPIQNNMMLMNPPKLSKKQRHQKGEYRKKLTDENYFLKKQIKELELQIKTKEAENNALQNQVQFFQQCMSTGTENNEANSPENSQNDFNNQNDFNDQNEFNMTNDSAIQFDQDDLNGKDSLKLS